MRASGEGVDAASVAEQTREREPATVDRNAAHGSHGIDDFGRAFDQELVGPLAARRETAGPVDLQMAELRADRGLAQLVEDVLDEPAAEHERGDT
jgi:hypothetical protein